MAIDLTTFNAIGQFLITPGSDANDDVLMKNIRISDQASAPKAAFSPNLAYNRLASAKRTVHYITQYLAHIRYMFVIVGHG